VRQRGLAHRGRVLWFGKDRGFDVSAENWRGTVNGMRFDMRMAGRWYDVALPLAGGAVGLLQARFRFCAAFGLAGIRNFGALGNVERVEDAEARRADRAKAITIFLVAGVLGLAGAALLAVLPV